MPLQMSNTFDDEVIIESLSCAFCSRNLDVSTISQREAHYEHHFINDVENQNGLSYVGSPTMPITVENVPDTPTCSNDSNTSNRTCKKDSAQKWKFPKETDVFWYAEQRTSPPSSCTPGLIPLLRKGLMKVHGRGNIRRAVLCNDNVVHVHREPWDAGWGCGYRNFLMLCGALMSQTQQPLYFPLLDSPLPPSIRNLQIWIEDAWKEGFDIEGQKELKKLVGTRKWIGTADLWVAFACRGIPAELVDFDFRDYPQGSDVVVNWVVNYFSPKQVAEGPANIFESLKLSPIISTDKMPLILQHDGHSRTIVGYEVDKNGVTNLLVFDPAHKPAPEIRASAIAEFTRLRSKHQDMGSNDLSNTVASPSNLKRKRSVDTFLQDGKVSKTGEPSKAKTQAFPSKVLSPLKNGFCKTEDNNEAKELDLFATVKKFRLDHKNLSKKKQYQILYFPMTAPLTDYEKRRKKEVTSTKIS